VCLGHLGAGLVGGHHDLDLVGRLQVQAESRLVRDLQRVQPLLRPELSGGGFGLAMRNEIAGVQRLGQAAANQRLAFAGRGQAGGDVVGQGLGDHLQVGSLEDVSRLDVVRCTQDLNRARLGAAVRHDQAEDGAGQDQQSDGEPRVEARRGEAFRNRRGRQ
jgi:hypothetical protein